VNLLEIVKDYHDRGWMPIPLPFRSKKITARGWQQWRFRRDELDKVFVADEQNNVGILLGKPSN